NLHMGGCPKDIYHCLSVGLSQPQKTTIFPYTTLFRSGDQGGRRPHAAGGEVRERHPGLSSCWVAAKSITAVIACRPVLAITTVIDRKSTRLNSSHVANSYAVFCLKKKTHTDI